MLKHIVVFKLKDRAEGADKAENLRHIKAGLEALPPKIKEIRFFEVGVNSINSAASYDLALYSKFDSEEDLLRYQKHPEHLKVADFVNKVCENRVAADYFV